MRRCRRGTRAGGADPTDWLVGALDQTGQALDSFGREAERVTEAVGRNSAAASGAYTAPEAELPVEFSPGPAETDALVLSSYMVGRALRTLERGGDGGLAAPLAGRRCP